MAITNSCKGLSLKLAGLFLGLLALFVSCSRQQSEARLDIASKQAIKNLADNGSLLNQVTHSGKNYVFSFETKELEIPESDIKKLVKDSARWETLITFADNTQLEVPSKGGSLDFIVKSIRLNPSGYNPLAAEVEVHLPAYGRIRVTVRGKNGEQGNITHLCNPLTPKQIVPVFGLYENDDNIVDLTFTDSKGIERGTTQIHIKTEKLPSQDIPKFRVITANSKKMEPGINFVNYPGASKLNVSIPYMVDDEGNIRWILLLKSSPDLHDLSISSGLKRSDDGNFYTGDQNQQRIVAFDMFGNLVKQWDLKRKGYTFHHDITKASNGNFLITVSKINARLQNGKPRVMDHIIEMNPHGGAIEKEWDLGNLIDTARYLKPDGITPPQFSQNPTNWAHNNSIIEFGKGLLATMRYQGIIGFSHEGALKWIISPHQYWDQKYRPYLLQPVDESGRRITDSAVINGEASADGFDWPWGPHTPIALSENRFLVFDNGYNRHWVSNALTKSKNYSRAVEYKIDKDKKTVQQLWAYGKKRGPECFAEALSGVQYLPQTGHILFCPGMGVPTSEGTGGRIVEIDPVNNNAVFEMEITVSSNTAFHRVTRMALYPDNF